MKRPKRWILWGYSYTLPLPSPRTVWCLTTNSTSIAERVAPYVCLISPCWLTPTNVNELGRRYEASDIIPKQSLTCPTQGLNKRQTLDNFYSLFKCPFNMFLLQSCSLTSRPRLRTPPPSRPKWCWLDRTTGKGWRWWWWRWWRRSQNRISWFLVTGDVFKLVVGCIKRKTLCLLCPSFSHTGSVILPSYWWLSPFLAERTRIFLMYTIHLIPVSHAHW